MRKKSFTLIEMLIVVVIIGILAAALIPRLQSVQARARDTKRKADLHQIATALLIYKEDNGGFNGFYTVDWGPGYKIFPITSYRDSNYYTESDQNFAFLPNLLLHYMTSIPYDSDQEKWVTAFDDDRGIHGYVFAPLNNHDPKCNSVLNAFVLAARTESDGSSSNRVTSASIIINNGTKTIVTGENNQRIGSVFGEGCYSNPSAPSSATASIYQQYLCNKVTLDSGTNNDGQGTCTADKNSSDLRYIFVQ